MAQDKIDQLYDALKADGAVEKSRENFRSKMLAPGKEGYQNRLKLYQALKADGAVESETYEDFAGRLGLHAVKPAKPAQPTQPQGNTAAPTETQAQPTQTPTTPTASAPTETQQRQTHQAQPQGTPLTEQDKIRMSYEVGQMASRAGRTVRDFNQRTSRAMEPLTQEGREARRAKETETRLQGGETHLFGIDATPKGETQTAQGDRQQQGTQSEQSPQPYGVVWEDGKAKTQWVLPDGTLTTSLVEANKAEVDARNARLEHDFRNRMEDNGLDPDKREDVQRQELLQEKARLEAEMKKRGSELDAEVSGFSWGDMPRGGGTNISTLNSRTNNGRTTDPKYRNLLAQYAKVDEALGVLDEAKNKKASDQWIDDSSNWFSKKGKQLLAFGAGTWRGLAHSVGQVGTWDMGMSDLITNKSIYDAAVNADKNGIDNISEDEQNLLRLTANANAIEAENGDLGRGYKAGNVTGESLPFMIEMIMNPAGKLGTAAASRLTREAIKRFGKEAVKKASKKYLAAKIGTRVVGDAAGAALMAGTTGQMRVTADMLNRMTGDIQFKEGEDGRIMYAGRENAEDNATKAYFKSFGAQTIENHSELVGAYFAPFLGKVGKAAGAGLGKIGLGRVNKLIDDIGATNAAKLIGDFEKRAKWNGTLGEYAEEVVGNIENAILVGDSTLDTQKGSGVFNLDQNIDTFLGVGLMGGFFSAARAVSYRGPKREAMKEMSDAGKAIDKAIGSNLQAMDLWGGYRNVLLVGTDEEKKEALKEVMGNSDLPMGFRMGVLNFAKAAQKYEGIVRAQQSKVKNGEQDPVAQAYDDSYDKGYETTDSEAIKQANEKLNMRRAILAEYLGCQPEEVDERIGDPLAAIGEAAKNFLTDDKPGYMATLVDYANTRSACEGMLQRVEDDTNSRIEQCEAEINGRTSQGDGKIHPLTLKVKDNDGNDRKAYLVSGNIVQYEDGSGIDIMKSDDFIVIRNAENGKLDWASPSSVLRMDETIDPDEEKSAAVQAIINESSQKARQDFDGVLAFNNGDEYTLTDADGNQSLVQVTADGDGIVDNGDGTVNVLADGRLMRMDKGTIQAMADNTRKQDIEAEVQKRTAAEGAQEQGTAPAEAGTSDEYTPAGTTAEEPAAQTSDVPAGEGNMPEYGVNDSFVMSFKTADGEETALHGEIQNVNEDGVEIRTAEPWHGKTVQVIPRKTFEGFIDELSDADGNKVWTRFGETTPTQPEAPIQATTPAETGQGQAEEGQGQSALSRVPVDEQTGEPQFEAVDSETALAALVEATGGNEENTKAIVEAQLQQADKELAALKKKQPTKRVPKLSGSPMAMIKAQQEADVEYNAAMEKYNAEMETAQKKTDAWNSIVKLAAERKKAVDEDIVWPEPTVGSNANTGTTEVADSPAEAVKGETVDRGGNSSQSISGGKDNANVPEKQGEGEKSSEKPLSEKIREASADVNTEPTEAQKKAGNYKKGHVQVGTFDITIEQPEGSVRRGTDADGRKWETKMHNTYGYIKGTEGVDGDHIDVFLSNDTDGWNGRKAFVVDQYNPDGTFDEHKVMLGFNDMDEAKGAYLSNYEKGWEKGRRIDVTPVNMEDFEKWIAGSRRKTKPFAEYKGVKKAEEDEQDKASKERRKKVAEWKNVEPLSAEEYAARMLGDGLRLIYDDFIKQTGYGREEAKKLFDIFASKEKGGVTLDRAGEILAENAEIDGVAHLFPSAAAGGQRVDAMEAKNILLDVLSEVRKRGDLIHYIENRRKAEEERFAELQREHDDEVCQEAYHMSIDDYEAYQDYLQENDPYKDVDVAELDEIMADAAERYEEYLKNRNNGEQGTETGRAEGGHSILPPSQPDKPRGSKEPAQKRGGDKAAGDKGAGEHASAQEGTSRGGVEAGAYTIEPSAYTNKKGKETAMSLLKFADELSDEQERALNEFAKERTGEGRTAKARGWKDRKNGGWLFRSEGDAKKAAAMVADAEAVADEQPLSAQELREAVGDKKPAESKTPTKKDGEKPKYEVSDEEMKGLMDDIRGILGIGDDEGDAGMMFRDPAELTAEQRQKLMSVGQRLAMAMVERGNESFSAYATKMVQALGDKVRPWLKAFYGGLEYVPGYDKYALTSYEEVKSFDVESFDKPAKSSIFAQAEMNVAESKAAAAARKANEELKDKRNEQRKRSDAAAGEYKVGDKVQFSPNGGRTWTDGVVADPNDADGIRIDTGHAPVLWVVAQPDQLRHKDAPQAKTAEKEEESSVQPDVEKIAANPKSWMGLHFKHGSTVYVPRYTNDGKVYMDVQGTHHTTMFPVPFVQRDLRDGNFSVLELETSKTKGEPAKSTAKKTISEEDIVKRIKEHPLYKEAMSGRDEETAQQAKSEIMKEVRNSLKKDGFTKAFTDLVFNKDFRYRISDAAFAKKEADTPEKQSDADAVDAAVKEAKDAMAAKLEKVKDRLDKDLLKGQIAARDKIIDELDGRVKNGERVGKLMGKDNVDLQATLLKCIGERDALEEAQEHLAPKPSASSVADDPQSWVGRTFICDGRKLVCKEIDRGQVLFSDGSFFMDAVFDVDTVKRYIKSGRFKMEPAKTSEKKNESIFDKAERVAKEDKEKRGIKNELKPEASSAKGGTKKKVKPEQAAGDLFAGLSDKKQDNGLERNHDAVRTEGLPSDSNEVGRGGSAGDNGKGTPQRSGQPDGSRESGSRRTRGEVSQSDGRQVGRLQGLGERKNVRNNHSERGVDHAPTSVNARINANIKAIELAHGLLESGETATPEQMSVLRQFSGWGGLGAAFNSNAADWKLRERNQRIRELLGEEAYGQAVLSANSAYYTPAYVVDTLWDIARQLGFKGGNILEGSAGIGNILGQIPMDMSDRSDIHAIEIDGTSGGILSLLYPDARVDIQGFEQTRIPNGSVDLAITNVPFVTGLRVNDTTGDGDLSKKFHNIHDFCIAKNVRKLREGGLGIFITSNGTLDNSKALRDWVVNEGGSDFIGAFRMNNETFGGTPVTSDIIIIRKRVNGKKSPNAIDVSAISGERTAEYQEQGERKAKQLSMDYNKYFIEHPDHMAGEMHFGFERGDTYRPTSKGLYPTSGKDQGEMLQEFARSLKEENDNAPQNTESQDSSLVLDASADDKKLGEMYMKDGKIVLANFGGYYPLEVNDKKIKGHTKQECFTDYAAIKSALADVMEYQTENEDNAGLQPLISKLNKAYDNFVAKYGHLNKNNQLAWLRNDVDYPNVFSLEVYKEQGDGKGGVVKTYDKADVMKGRVVEKESEPHPENVKDGVVVSMFKNGRIDIPYIAGQLRLSEEAVKREIIGSGLGFEDPATRQVEVSYQYLSGNVREKLKQAEANNENGEYTGNIKALQDVVPMNIPAHLIEFTLGSSWLDPKLYDEYVKDRTDIDVHFTAAGGTWFMKAPDYGLNKEKNRAMGVVSEKLHKTVMGHELIGAAIQNKTIVVSRIEKHYDGTTETITDREATAACAAKIDEIRQDFKDWARQKMQSDADLSARMEAEYNDRFNNYVPMNIPDSFVPEFFEGANHKFTMRPHQGKAIVRGTMQPLLLAHEVGTGKTFTLISTAMEMRRLGTARKPMIVVQNATVGQFAADAKSLYPGAKILTLDDSDRNAEGRKNFYAKIKYNDWDMIIVPQSTFEFIPDSGERQMQFVQDKIDEKMLVLEQMREADSNGRDPMTRRAEKELADLQAEMAALSEEISKKRTAADEKKKAVAKQNAAVRAQEMLDRRTDDVEDFDDMGIDALLVDEAHEYKHLGFATAMQRGVKGVDPSYSKKSQGVYLKTQAVLEKMGGRNVIFATGTPISNTAAEIWTFMRYLMPKDTMKEYGIYYFDDFVRNFGNIQQMPEFNTSGKFKEVNRFAGYVNLPELVRIWSGAADTVLTKDQKELVEKIPEMEGGKAQDIYLPQTRALRSVMKYVRAELERYENMSGKEKKENSHIPLTMYGIAQGAAVDARLVETGAEDEPNSKTNEAVRQTLRSLKETDSYKGTVAIFADHYQNKRSGFNLYEDIKKKLIAQGVPESEIAVMKPGMTIKKKQEIFDKVNHGEVRVIMGSTATLGTGVNIQERLHTLIHLDAPNRPMDYTQRNGRILRQGNLHKEWGKPVRVLRFGVEDSLDVTAYQRLKTKGAIADSIMEGDKLMHDSMNNRVLEEEEDVFGDTVAQLSGSEYALLKNNAEKNVRKYESRKKQWEADQTYIHNAKPKLEGQIKAAEQRAEDAESHLHAVQKTFPDGKFTEITVGKHKFGSVEAMADFIKEHNKKILDATKTMRENPGSAAQTSTLTLSTGGYNFVVKTEMSRETVNSNGSLFAEVHRKMSYSCPELGLNDAPVKQSLLRNAVEDIVENVITGKDFAEQHDIAARAVARDKSELEQLKQREGKPFEFAKELEEARRQLDEYTEAMKQELEEKEKKYAEMDASVEAAKDIVSDEEDGTSADGDTKFRLLDADDPKVRELEALDESELVPVYRNVQAFEDDALGSPMAFTDAETGERRTLEGKRWNYSAPRDITLTAEQQKQLDELNRNGYIIVDGKKATELKINDGLKFVKPKTKEAQLQYFLKKSPEDKGLWAAYNPYDHAIETPLNTQFGEAYKRPNLVVVRSLIPKSELDMPFKADFAKDATGAHLWNNGRTLYLSRWSKIDKVLSREEEARLIDQYWKANPGKREALVSHRDYNRFVPQVRRELEKMGYRFELDGKELTPEESRMLDEQTQAERDIIPGKEGRLPFVTDADIDRINAKMAGKWVGEPKAALENAMADRVEELSEKLNTPVRIIRTTEEAQQLPTARQRRQKGSFNPRTGEVTIVVPNNANMADIENTFVHEVVGHDGLRVLFPEEETFNNAMDELYRVSADPIKATIDATAKKMYDAEVDRIRERKRKEHEAKGEEVPYYADMAEAHVEASKKKDKFRRDATEEYGADLAGRIGDEGFEKMSAEEQTFWGKLKSMLQNALRKLLDGLRIPGVRKWTDKEWAFILHEAYKRKLSGGKPSVFDMADTEVMRRKTGFDGELVKGGYLVTIRRNVRENGKKIADKNWVLTAYSKNAPANTKAPADGTYGSTAVAPGTSSDAKVATISDANENSDENVSDDGLMFRDSDPIEYEKLHARDLYERRVKTGMYQTHEAFLDSMLGLKEAMDAVMTAEGHKVNIEEIDDFENPYLGENRLSSVNKAEKDVLERTLYRPLYEIVARLARNRAERDELTDYMMAKHGLERNEVMARRAAAKQAEAEFAKEYNAAAAAVAADPLDSLMEAMLIDVQQRRHDREEELYFENRGRDYSGLTALTMTDNVADAEAEAQEMVKDYELFHDAATLWDRVRDLTRWTLRKTYESGMMNKATYDDIRGMYQYYIPLRGFDEKTSEEAYAYLNSKHSIFNAPLKTARGRKSKADDPLSNMEMMAESAISQGNRNTLVKQKFLNFVLNHPSDLTNVSDLWLRHDDVKDEWVPVFTGDVAGTEAIDPDDSPAEVERKMQDFEEVMQQLAGSDAAHFVKQSERPDVPYRVVQARDMHQHQVLVRRNGKEYIVTVNGNPRAAQAVNGQTNPDNDASGYIANTRKFVGDINRTLSTLYTTLQPDFVASNFMRDLLYANTMVHVKENEDYALAFNNNYLTLPRTMSLLGEYRKGTLDLSKRSHRYFKEFIENGGETGFIRMADIDEHKKKIQEAIDAMNAKIPAAQIRESLGTWLGEISRGIEMRARFAAYVTSREAGRSVGRSIWDAKEISVNFNKKGSGDRFMNAEGQTFAGNAAAFVSGTGRDFFIFWNAGLQGTFGNFLKMAFRHPKKMSVAASIALGLGILIPALASLLDDDDDSYYDIPKHIRRQNFIVKLPGGNWAKVPLPIEQRSIYGLGEMIGCALFNNEQMELEDALVQINQLFPVDMAEGWNSLWPSAIKPITEVVRNETWYGSPIWKETPWNTYAPEWTKAYKSANPDLVALTAWINESKLSGGDKYSGGAIDLNPAAIEYLLKQYTGGFFTLANQLRNLVGTATGEKDFDWRYVPLANRMVMSGGDERNAGRGLNDKFFRYMAEYEAKTERLSAIRKDPDITPEERAALIMDVFGDEKFRTLRTYSSRYDKLNSAALASRKAGNEERAVELEKKLTELKRELVEKMKDE